MHASSAIADCFCDLTEVTWGQDAVRLHLSEVQQVCIIHLNTFTLVTVSIWTVIHETPLFDLYCASFGFDYKSTILGAFKHCLKLFRLAMYKLYKKKTKTKVSATAHR